MPFKELSPGKLTNKLGASVPQRLSLFHLQTFSNEDIEPPCGWNAKLTMCGSRSLSRGISNIFLYFKPEYLMERNWSFLIAGWISNTLEMTITQKSAQTTEIWGSCKLTSSPQGRVQVQGQTHDYFKAPGQKGDSLPLSASYCASNLPIIYYQEVM